MCMHIEPDGGLFSKIQLWKNIFSRYLEGFELVVEYRVKGLFAELE